MPAVDNVIGVDGGLIAGGASADGAVRIFK